MAFSETSVTKLIPTQSCCGYLLSTILSQSDKERIK